MRRRSFLRALGGLGPALGAAATVGASGCGPGCGSPGTGGFFDERERRIVQAVAETLVGADPADPEGLPSVQDAGVVDFLDDLVPRLSEEIQDKLPWLLWGVEHGTRVFSLTLAPFSELSPAAREAYLLGWSRSRIALRRLGFRALKNLVMLAYYTHESTWPAIGYEGPWVGREVGEREGFGGGPGS